MCTASLGIAAVGAAANFQQQRQQAKFQQKVQDRNATINNQQAIKAANSSNQALAAKRTEQALATAAAKENLNREVLKARGVARLGGAGSSVGAVLSDLASQQATASARIDRGADFALQQSDRDAAAISERARGRSLGQYSIPQPSLALAAINFAGSKGVTSYIDKTFE